MIFAGILIALGVIGLAIFFSLGFALLELLAFVLAPIILIGVIIWAIHSIFKD